MDIGLVGLGKMGENLAHNLKDHGHRVIGFARTEETRTRVAAEGIEVADSFEEMVTRLPERKVVWLMVNAGEPTNACINQALELLSPGDILVDGGNTLYKDSEGHAELAKEKGVLFLDVGTSGGTSGARNGACYMIGGDEEAFSYLEPVFNDTATEEGYLYTGRAGSGHLVKMIHNGVEYGMMQAIGEGFALLQASEFELDLQAIAHMWNHGSVVRSWLVEIMEDQLGKHPGLKDIEPICDTTGEARWTVDLALDQEIPAPVITLALMARNATKDTESFSAKSVAVMRNGFGDHALHVKGSE